MAFGALRNVYEGLEGEIGNGVNGLRVAMGNRETCMDSSHCNKHAYNMINFLFPIFSSTIKS